MKQNFCLYLYFIYHINKASFNFQLLAKFENCVSFIPIYKQWIYFIYYPSPRSLFGYWSSIFYRIKSIFIFLLFYTRKEIVSFAAGNQLFEPQVLRYWRISFDSYRKWNFSFMWSKVKRKFTGNRQPGVTQFWCCLLWLQDGKFSLLIRKSR